MQQTALKRMSSDPFVRRQGFSRHLRPGDLQPWCNRWQTSLLGGVEWLTSKDDHRTTVISGLQLVHRDSCRYDPLKVFQSGRSIVERFSL